MSVCAWMWPVSSRASYQLFLNFALRFSNINIKLLRKLSYIPLASEDWTDPIFSSTNLYLNIKKLPWHHFIYKLDMLLISMSRRYLTYILLLNCLLYRQAHRIYYIWEKNNVFTFTFLVPKTDVEQQCISITFVGKQWS